MKKFLIAALSMLSMYSYAQVSHAYNPNPIPSGDQQSKTPGLTDLVEKKDDVTGATIYYNSGNHIDKLRGEGMYAIIYKKDSIYDLKMIVYHNVGSTPVYGG